MSSSPSGLIARARSYPTLGALLFGGIGGFILAIFEGGIRVVVTTLDFFVQPIAALTNELGNVITAFVGGGASIIGQGAQSTIASLAPTGAWYLGPFTFAGAIVAATLGLGVMAFIISLSPTSDLIPFSFTDFPLLGVDEDEEELPEED